MHAIQTLNTADRATAALHYCALGWRVIPLQEKKPITPWTTDPPLKSNVLQILFAEPCDFNIGIVMGAPSQIVGLDIDGPAGMEHLTSLLLNYNIDRTDFFNTLAFTTPNSGLRLLYQYDPRLISRSLRHNGKELLRIMTDGTQTVAPPSTLGSRPYLWLTSPRLAPCPFEFFNNILEIDIKTQPRKETEHRLVSKTDAFNRARAFARKCDPAISGQGGHNQTYKVALRILKGFNLSYHQALDILLNDYNDRCEPPWTTKEIEHKLDEVLKDTSPYRNML